MKILIITIDPNYNKACLEAAQYLLGMGSSIMLATEEELIWLDTEDYDHILKDPSMEVVYKLLKGDPNASQC